MRRAALALLATALAGASLAGAGPAAAQTEEAIPATFRTNFAVPDAPAFQLLNVDPGTILRPQTPRELALALAGFQGSEGGFVVPRAVAVEFSPGILIRGSGLTQESYQRNRLWNALRLSLATWRPVAGSEGTRLALGVRLTLVDEAGVGTDESFPPELRVQPALDSIHAIAAESRSRAIHTPENRDRRPSEIRATLEPGERAEVDRLSRRIARLWEERYWNVSRWDVAFAARVRAADSAGSDPRLDALSAWITGARAAGRWGQLLAGMRAGATRDSARSDALHGEASLSTRLYAGTNRAKAFLEAQGTWHRSEAPEQFLDGGLECAALDWVWIELHAGIEHSARGRTRLTTAFRMKIAALPGHAP